MELDESKLSPDQVDAILLNMPTAEEKKIINAMSTETREKADKPEKFFLMLERIPKYLLRIQCWQTALHFEEKINEVTPLTLLVTKACRQVRQSRALRSVFGLILAFGNYMNGGNKSRGQADGFTIESLNKITAVKSSDGVPLVKYIAAEAIELDNKVLNLKEEVACLDKATRVDLSDLRSQVNSINGQIKKTKQQYKIVVEATNKPGDPFNTRLADFLKKAENTCGMIARDMTVAETNFKDLVMFIECCDEKKVRFTKTLRAKVCARLTSFLPDESNLRQKKRPATQINGVRMYVYVRT